MKDMQKRRSFMTLTGGAIAGAGLLTTVQHNGRGAQVTLELRNNADIRTELVARVEQAPGSDATVRRRELGPGEREHFDIKIDGTETYEMTGNATVSSDDVTVEGFGNTPDVSVASFQTRSAAQAILKDDDHIIVILTPEKTVQVKVVSETD